ncbi:MAG: STAS domain-containing protein [Spirochaetota bacterium]
MDFSYIIEDHRYFKIFKIYGNLSILKTEIFERVINNITKTTCVIVDCTDLGLMTSAGVESLVNVSLAAKRNGNRVLFYNLPQQYYRLATMMNYLDFLIIIETIEEGKVKIRYYT